MPEPHVVMPVSQAGRGRTMHLVEFEQILCFLASFGSHCGAAEWWFCGDDFQLCLLSAQQAKRAVQQKGWCRRRTVTL